MTLTRRVSVSPRRSSRTCRAATFCHTLPSSLLSRRLLARTRKSRRAGVASCVHVLPSCMIYAIVRFVTGPFWLAAVLSLPLAVGEFWDLSFGRSPVADSASSIQLNSILFVSTLHLALQSTTPSLELQKGILLSAQQQPPRIHCLILSFFLSVVRRSPPCPSASAARLSPPRLAVSRGPQLLRGPSSRARW